MPECPKCHAQRRDSSFTPGEKYCKFCVKKKNRTPKGKRISARRLRRKRMIASGAPDGKMPYDLRRELLKFYKYRCLKCGARKHLQIDHIIPVAKNGLTRWDNLQVLCRTCNISKGTKIIDYRNAGNPTQSAGSDDSTERQ